MDGRTKRVQENIIWIALGCFKEIDLHTDIPTDIIVTMVQAWGEEAEDEWEKNGGELEYREFIDAFIDEKLKQTLEEYKD